MIKYLYVTCGEGGPLLDTVEYDDAQTVAPAVAEVAAALAIDVDEARKLVARKNPGAEVNSYDSARQLAEQIASRSVPDRDPSTYIGPDGYDGPLVVTDVRPPAAPMALVTKTEVSP